MVMPVRSTPTSTLERQGPATRTNPTLQVDLVTNNKQTLLRFDDVFGGASGQIPYGATIDSATLGINVSNASVSGAQLYRMIAPWTDSDTWSTRGNGIDTDGVEAESAFDSSSTGSGTGFATIVVTADVQAWSDGAVNRGWAWLQAVDDSWQFDSSEVGTPANRPMLTVEYTAPSSTSVWSQVSQSSDDAEERDDGAMDLGSSDLEMVRDTADNTADLDQVIGLRFQNVSVPPGAAVLEAHIEFVADEAAIRVPR